MADSGTSTCASRKSPPPVRTLAWLGLAWLGLEKLTKQCITSDTGDCDADPNYSLSDDSYSDTSDNKSSSFDDVSVSALKIHNVYFLPQR